MTCGWPVCSLSFHRATGAKLPPGARPASQGRQVWTFDHSVQVTEPHPDEKRFPCSLGALLGGVCVPGPRRVYAVVWQLPMLEEAFEKCLWIPSQGLCSMHTTGQWLGPPLSSCGQETVPLPATLLPALRQATLPPANVVSGTWKRAVNSVPVVPLQVARGVPAGWWVLFSPRL